MNKGQFVCDVTYWNSYLPLLWLALENTSGDVIELGMGDGSTSKLHEYCQLKQRNLFSYETDVEYYRKFEDLIVNNENFAVHEIECVYNNWQVMIERHRGPVGVLFSDEAPGEMRKYNISMFCNTAQVIVVHDSEQTNDHGYKLSLVAPLFKYRKDFDYPGASATAFSNFIDVSKWSIQDNTQPAAIMSS
jgi:hypothetical protein